MVRRKIKGMNFEECVDYVEEGNEYGYYIWQETKLQVMFKDHVYVVYDEEGAQLVFGDNKVLSRED